MPEHYVGISDDNGDKVVVDAAGNLTILQGATPGAQFYLHWLPDTAGVVASNNFMSLFNPVGSGKTVQLFLASVTSYAVGASTTAASMNVFRTTAASGGTLIAASAVGKFATVQTNALAEMRHSNPSTTNINTSVQAFAPPISSGAGTGSASNATSPPGAGALLFPGEGVVFNTSAGDIDQRWNIGLVWSEF